MSKYMKRFANEAAFNTERYGENYGEPWLGVTENMGLSYNMKDYERYLHTPLTLEFKGTGAFIFRSVGNIVRTIEYSKNGGEWTSITCSNTAVDDPTNTARINVVNGDTIAFRGDNANYCDASDPNTRASLRVVDCNFEVKGNIMSLLSSTGWESLTTFSSNSAFGLLFSFDTTLVDAHNLILPATYLKNRCYYWMFYQCTSLLYSPELPENITNIERQAMKNMFHTCTSLIKAPSTIGNSSTTMNDNCCGDMFTNCTSLTVAPELPIPTLVVNAYEGTFNGCSSLNYIKCLLENPYVGWMNNFVTGVSSTGTFVKKNGITWTRGVRGIPTNWDVNVLS